MRNKWLLLTALVASCSSSPEALETSQNSARTEKSYGENYQAVFRRIADTAKRCQSTAGEAAFTVDSQLYSDLGFGEITMSMVSSLYPRDYYWKAKVERSGAGSKVLITYNNGKSRSITSPVSRWADGDTKC